MRVFVYWNFHKKVFSVRHRGRVIAHATDLLLENAEFRVSESGRQRVLASGQKNVHAGISGEVLACDSPIGRCSPLLPDWHMGRGMMSIFKIFDADNVRYNPYDSAHFVIVGNRRRIDSARQVYCHANRLSGTPNVWARQ